MTLEDILPLVDERHRKNIALLRNAKEVGVFRECLQAILSSIDNDNRRLEGVKLYQSQGAAQMLETIEDLFDYDNLMN